MSEPLENIKVLVLTLYSGEKQLDECTSALQEQSYSNWEQKIFRFLPNVEAHRRLYREIMRRAGEFDLFVKLDADMVLSHVSALEEMVGRFVEDPGLDHAVFPVHDWYSGRDIMGVHVFTGRARWSERDDRVFVDPSPAVPGTRCVFSDDEAVAEHAPEPTLEEAFLFGRHRALKIVQRGRWFKNVGQADFQLGLLCSVWEMFLASEDLRRGAALWAAEEVFSNAERQLESKTVSWEYENSIKSLQGMGLKQLQDTLRSRWSPGLILSWRRWRCVSLPAAVKVCRSLGARGAKVLRLRPVNH
ncbi:MAG: hypothetical protein JSU95_17565 [Betaproteobacteria bacterium]|nr:MAG: hypothetical protein JSU95_17565 [Betaproteobacteria bacterium]